MVFIANNPGASDPLSTRAQWKTLGLFLLYRMLLVSALLFLFLSQPKVSFLGRSQPELFLFTAGIYALLVLVNTAQWARRDPGVETQALMMVFIDIVAGTLIMHSSGGANSGLGILLAVSIAMGTLLTSGRKALLLAAIASLAVLAQQVYTHFAIGLSDTAYMQAGLLGALFFAIALLAYQLSGQLRASERQVSQQQLDLANLAQLNEYIIQHMQTGVLVVDNELRIRLMNDTAWYLLNMPAAGPGDELAAAYPTLDELLRDWRANPGVEPEPFKITPGVRELKPAFAALGQDATTGTLIFLDDSSMVTQRAQQMKLASLGRLTASIAHEIRNPLGAIGHASQLLDESSELPAGDKRLAEIIRDNTSRVNTIIENVLQISRRSRSAPETLHLPPWLQTFVEEWAHLHKLAENTITVRITPEDTVVSVDPSQLRQVVTNLCDNALVHGGATRNFRIRILAGASADNPAPFMDIIDNGPGITPENARQIFEPFFTTRNAGTGLGLYMARELCEMNRCQLEYIPVPAGGSCFRIRFPALPPGGQAA